MVLIRSWLLIETSNDMLIWTSPLAIQEGTNVGQKHLWVWSVSVHLIRSCKLGDSHIQLNSVWTSSPTNRCVTSNLLFVHNMSCKATDLLVDKKNWIFLFIFYTFKSLDLMFCTFVYRMFSHIQIWRCTATILLTIFCCPTAGPGCWLQPDGFHSLGLEQTISGLLPQPGLLQCHCWLGLPLYALRGRGAREAGPTITQHWAFATMRLQTLQCKSWSWCFKKEVIKIIHCSLSPAPLITVTMLLTFASTTHMQFTMTRVAD